MSQNVYSSDAPNIIVSILVSEKAVSFLPEVLEKLSQQSVSAKKFIVWISTREFESSENLLDSLSFDFDNIQVERVDTLSSSKVLFLTQQMYPTDAVILAEGDRCYSEDFIKGLYEASLSSCDSILSYRCNRIRLNENGLLKPYVDWLWNDQLLSTEASYLNVPILLGGGIWVPPGLFCDKKINFELLENINPYIEGVHLYLMALEQNIKIKKIIPGIYFAPSLNSHSISVPNLFDDIDNYINNHISNNSQVLRVIERECFVSELNQKDLKIQQLESQNVNFVRIIENLKNESKQLVSQNMNLQKFIEDHKKETNHEIKQLQTETKHLASKLSNITMWHARVTARKEHLDKRLFRYKLYSICLLLVLIALAVYKFIIV